MMIAGRGARRRVGALTSTAGATRVLTAAIPPSSVLRSVVSLEILVVDASSPRANIR